MKKKEIVRVAAGMLAGIAISGPAAQAAEKLTVQLSRQRVFMDGKQVQIQAYNINGYNYVKLGDLSGPIGFALSYDDSTNSVYIGEQPEGTGDGYLTNGRRITEENVLALLREVETDWPTGTLWCNPKVDPNTKKNEIPSTEADRIMTVCPVNSVYGCGGYVAMVSSLLFGDRTNPGRKLEDPTRMRPVTWSSRSTASRAEWPMCR